MKIEVRVRKIVKDFGLLDALLLAKTARAGLFYNNRRSTF